MQVAVEELASGKVSFGVGGTCVSMVAGRLPCHPSLLFSSHILVFSSTKVGAQGSEKHSRQGSHLQPSLEDSSPGPLPGDSMGAPP